MVARSASSPEAESSGEGLGYPGRQTNDLAVDQVNLALGLKAQLQARGVERAMVPYYSRP